MSKKNESKLIVGLDIGTSKVLAIVGEVNAAGDVEIIGYGHHPATGMRKGVVANIEETVTAIQRAVEEAELMAGCQIYSVYAGIAGAHINSFNSHGVVAVRDSEVDANDVERVIESAKAVAIPNDQSILHVLPQEFIIDGQEGIRHPIGMNGIRLEANLHMVTASVSSEKNIEKCIRRCGLEVDDIILEQLASCESVLTNDEKELGVCLVDIGGGTTDIAVYAEGAVRHTAVIPVAGDQITNDIAIALRTPTASAEDLKRRYACALRQLAPSDESIEVQTVGDRPARKLSKQTLAEVVEPRVEELFELIKVDLRRNGFEHMIRSGVVLTGGSSKMEGMIELAEEIFHLPVRLGTPKYLGGLSEVVKNPIYSTGVGLVLFGHRNQSEPKKTAKSESKVSVLTERVKHWFQGNF
ncbi:cell division protein FtsA [Arenicella xantha]|uniref:Cell division protein FtsA n=1 Tax=Arenicella xantha TaxID=644221 RepID=A0A395JIA6_9GAMM|nr:cell division protein FtsA [Arenicella xantha]RBP49870.1 cell division protein FtsA [Arenicella xantha]